AGQTGIRHRAETSGGVVEIAAYAAAAVGARHQDQAAIEQAPDRRDAEAVSRGRFVEARRSRRRALVVELDLRPHHAAQREQAPTLLPLHAAGEVRRVREAEPGAAIGVGVAG